MLSQGLTIAAVAAPEFNEPVEGPIPDGVYFFVWADNPDYSISSSGLSLDMVKTGSAGNTWALEFSYHPSCDLYLIKRDGLYLTAIFGYDENTGLSVPTGELTLTANAISGSYWAFVPHDIGFTRAYYLYAIDDLDWPQLNAPMVVNTDDDGNRTIVCDASMGEYSPTNNPGFAGSFIFKTIDEVLYSGWTLTYEPGEGAVEGSMLPSYVMETVGTKIDTCAYKRPGYEFVGWNTEKNGSGTPYKPGEVIDPFAEEIPMLYAQWEKLPDEPVKPEGPSGPDNPGEADEPSNGDDKPSTPDKPSNGDDKPSTPDKPSKPANPSTPDKPSNPSAPSKPSAPDTPSTPAKPTNPGGNPSWMPVNDPTPASFPAPSADAVASDGFAGAWTPASVLSTLGSAFLAGTLENMGGTLRSIIDTILNTISLATALPTADAATLNPVETVGIANGEKIETMSTEAFNQATGAGNGTGGTLNTVAVILIALLIVSAVAALAAWGASAAGNAIGSRSRKHD